MALERGYVDIAKKVVTKFFGLNTRTFNGEEVSQARSDSDALLSRG